MQSSISYRRREGDEILVVDAEGKLGTDTVSLLSIGRPEAAAPSYVALTTSLNTTLTLTPGHHLPVGEKCCSSAPTGGRTRSLCSLPLALRPAMLLPRS